MLRSILILLLFVSFSATAQLTDKYTSDYANFYRAEELFEKDKFSAAQEEFKTFMNDFNEPNHAYFIKARFYHALCALYLYHANAEQLLLSFLADYPESIYRQKVYFELGRYYFRKNKFDKVIEWLSQVDPLDLEEDQLPEYYFKLGYAHFRKNEPKAARDAFYEIINVESQYQHPALYYYSHIAYSEKNYQVALEGFRKLEEDPAFKKTVPPYIAQILYLQGKYDELMAYAPDAKENASEKSSIEMAHLIGDAFYRTGRYDEAVPFLEEYNSKSATTRDEDYQLGFAYYKSGQYMKAVQMFDKVAQVRDEMGQLALYHIGDCYMKSESYLYARNAFELAAAMHFDKEIEEDALYNYAILSYKIDFNPFDEAVEALNLYLERYPDSHRRQDIYQYLINVYTTMKNYRSAMESIEKVEKLDYNLKHAYQMMAYNYSVELFDNSQYRKSIENFELVRKYPIDPELNAMSHYWTAEAYYKLNEFDKSINAYKSFLNVPGSYGMEQHNDAYYNIAYCYFKKADYEPAIQNFRTFTQDPKETSHEKIADAYLRIGDAYFVSEKDMEAIDFYNRAIAENGGQVDYAKFQVGLALGFQRKYAEKAKRMLDIVNNHKGSTFAVPALYEAAEAFRLNNENSKALQHYEKLIIDFPNHPKVVDAVFQTASLNFIQENYDLAEKGYLRVINEFHNESKKKEALARLKDLYATTNQPDKYEQLLGQLNMTLSSYEKDTLYYFNALDLYSDSSFRQAISAFDKYLKEFPNPSFFTEAHYYKGASHHRLGEKEQAAIHFKQVLTRPNGIYTEFAALVASQDEYKNKNYDKAISYYEKLLETASYPENKLTANIGLMRCYTFKENYIKARPYAQAVLDDDLSLSNVIIEAHYVLGNADLINVNYLGAETHFRYVAKNTKGEIGAESQFRIAEIYHLQEEYKKSEDEIRKLMKEHASYDYWKGKALILQAKNSIGIEDYTQAEFTLNSVINNYPNQTDGIIDEANEVMQVLQGLKNKEKEIPDDNGNTIEIGG
ncbi:tetratricopeptide repeat protein [Paracrocinitomix mangrovi]|uniref:tetratricopeptide repeat protein n=1 Tax=Paracrocinitomix mangrovi TaxID=2862509 RepID=UPI001C8D7E96|nr:tetratricopeptide repeat protein [Paracrocinitomix mangrovi]UKN00998.1 tetratricopeptide repeat protein [Paracrocinitomix mangrovi]